MSFLNLVQTLIEKYVGFEWKKIQMVDYQETSGSVDEVDKCINSLAKKLKTPFDESTVFDWRYEENHKNGGETRAHSLLNQVENNCVIHILVITVAPLTDLKLVKVAATYIVVDGEQ